MDRKLLNKQYKFNTIIPISTRQGNVTEHDYQRGGTAVLDSNHIITTK